MADVFTEIGTVLFLLFICGTKFLTGPAVVLAAGYNEVETFFISFIGASLGCVIFFFLGGAIFKWWQRYFPGKKKRSNFSRKNRMIVRLKNKFGIYGLVALIPVISIPVSCFLAAKYFRYDKKAIPAYIAASGIYSALLTVFSKPVIELLKSLF
jgi:membrane protein DedA with SNARE-associated domain